MMAEPLRPGPDFSQDPHPFLGALTDAGPVHRVLLPDGTESWWVTRYEEWMRVLAEDGTRA